MNNKKILVILLIAALALTMVSISSFAYGPKQGNFSGGTETSNRFAGQGQGPGGQNINPPAQNSTPRGMFNLELTAEQQAKMREMMFSFQKESLELRNQIQVKQLEMRELRLADELDMEQVKSKLEEIAALQVELRMKAVERQDKVKELLTPEQLKNCGIGSQMQRFGSGMKGFNFNQGYKGSRGGHW